MRREEKRFSRDIMQNEEQIIPEMGMEEEALQEEEEKSSEETVSQADVRSVPKGYADMRVGKMTDDGFIKSDGRYAEYYYSAKWQGEALSSGDTTLAMGQITYCMAAVSRVEWKPIPHGARADARLAGKSSKHLSRV